MRTTVTKISATIAIIFTTFASPTWCAPPLATDDASTLTPGACQFEIEQRRFRNRIERDVASACNFLFDAEIGIGHQRITLDGVPRADSVVYQFKKVLVPAEENGWAVGIAAATVRTVNEKPGDHSGTRQNILNAVASRQFGVTALHVNVALYPITNPHRAPARIDCRGPSPPSMKRRHAAPLLATFLGSAVCPQPRSLGCVGGYYQNICSSRHRLARSAVKVEMGTG